MITKTLTGVPFFDKRYGGIYRGRPMLISGRSGSGKSVLGLQFVLQGLRQNERCLILSARPMADVIIFAEAMQLSLSDAIESENLILLEYSDYIPGRDREENVMLPSDGFLQFEQIIETHAVQRVVLDTILPWVSIRPQTHLAEHVFSFVRAFDRLGITTLMTIPKPASLPSLRLKNAVEEVVPVSVTLSTIPNYNEFAWITTKYLGEMKLDQDTPYQITPGLGIDRASASRQSREPIAGDDLIKDESTPLPPSPVQNNTPTPKPTPKIRFADILKQ